ncbi:hypothetical protein JYU04_01930 [Dehalococcoides mccartyi]|nr:hypothetical protein [Dehalococcoides mccartyi]
MVLRYKTAGMRYGIVFMGMIVALASIVFISETISARTDKSPQHIYQVEWANGNHTGSTGGLFLGDHKYYDGDLFALGEGPLGTPIGKQRAFDFASEPIGTPGGVEWGSFAIDGVGNIFTAHVFGAGIDLELAITGGTGAFRGANGYATNVRISPSVRLFTFYFDRPLAP